MCALYEINRCLFHISAIYTLQYLDIITMKDPSQKAHFYRHQLSDVLPYIPKVSTSTAWQTVYVVATR